MYKTCPNQLVVPESQLPSYILFLRLEMRARFAIAALLTGTIENSGPAYFIVILSKGIIAVRARPSRAREPHTLPESWKLDPENSWPQTRTRLKQNPSQNYRGRAAGAQHGNAEQNGKGLERLVQTGIIVAGTKSTRFRSSTSGWLTKLLGKTNLALQN
ncbi:hypothetical protein K438DRAFT_1779410 [Mycena galopus ATCC 62051]|nr:hypothetical protein K438DRAFT_1779410 [Mycena galopus ATCC 62051]